MDPFIQNLQSFILFCRELIHFEALCKCDTSEGTKTLCKLNKTIIEQGLHIRSYLEMWSFILKQQQKLAYGSDQRKHTLQINKIDNMLLDISYLSEKLQNGVLLSTSEGKIS